MNSPELMSPVDTSPSSTPPNEEINYQPPSQSDKGFVASLTSQLFTSGSSKRRLPGGGGSYGGSSSSRDLKSRRRENSSRMNTGEWDLMKGQGGKREKDELLDQGLVDYLRKEIGDPFQEPRP
ncbi:hypothetical protein CC1G_10177 [Coprinopsis cinerea okayama7|uniref:Uncharacterized protein n=1 Tax=Coprinopsis cinerea (strain Okayama-7 / 130 / ATCC MYA-4618 / FGSC 9003) TaxID=240176 RepID=A8PGB9_COPC7|nr:hypothetical protein CC1G_10177 [Coprinopsis cinerea okayama7\|eukprot:XP_001841180.2 hypothetical protein CC1G_10177 [Coprinopsis cinerea okayama7\